MCESFDVPQAKEAAEARIKEMTAEMKSLTVELQNEKLVSSSARDSAKRANRECVAIKRAVQSLGCKVYISADGDCSVGIESNATEIPQNSLYTSSRNEKDSPFQRDENPDHSRSVAIMPDDPPDSPFARVCESLCPMRTREGGCRWPNAGCTRFGSQFVGLKANFEAFDRLSIFDSYFESQ